MRLKLLTLILSVMILPAMSWAASAPDISGQAICSGSAAAGDYFENNRITWTMPVAPPTGTTYIVSYKNPTVTTWTPLSNNATSPYTPPRPTSAYTYYQVSSVDGTTPTTITPSKTIIIYKPARSADPYCGNSSNPTFPALDVDSNGNLDIGLKIQEDGVTKSVAILPPTQSSNLKIQRYDLTFSVSLVAPSVSGLRTRFQVAGAEKRLGAFNGTTSCSLSCTPQCLGSSLQVQNQIPNASCNACIPDGNPPVASVVDIVTDAASCTGGVCGGQTCALNTHCRTTTYTPNVCAATYECIPDTGCGGSTPTCDSRPTCYGSYTDADGPNGADTGFRMACCNGKVTSFTDKGGNVPACPATTSNSITCDWSGAKTFAGEPQETPRSRMTITCTNNAVTALDVTGQPANFTTTTFNWDDDGDGNDLMFRKNSNTPLGFDGIGYHGLNGDIDAPGWSGCCSAAPANATMCANDGSSTNTTSTVVTACSATNACEFTCNTGYARSGASTCTAIVYQCFGSPAHAIACSGDTANLTSNASSKVVNECTDDTKCEYTCDADAGYFKSGNSCVPLTCSPQVIVSKQIGQRDPGTGYSYASPLFESNVLFTVKVEADDLSFSISMKDANGASLDVQRCLGTNDHLLGVLDNSCGFPDGDGDNDSFTMNYMAHKVGLSVTEIGGVGDDNVGYTVTAQKLCAPANGGIVAYQKIMEDTNWVAPTMYYGSHYYSVEGSCSLDVAHTANQNRAANRDTQANIAAMKSGLQTCCAAQGKTLNFNDTAIFKYKSDNTTTEPIENSLYSYTCQ